MTVTLSAPIKAGMLAGATEEGLIPLLVIEHADLAAPVRLSADRVDTVSRGNIYTAFPFDVSIPDDIHGEASAVQLTLVDLSRDITGWLRTIRSKPMVTIELVRLDDPDSLEASFTGFRLQEPHWEPPQPTITARLVAGHAGGTRWPHSRFVPRLYPGLF